MRGGGENPKCKMSGRIVPGSSFRGGFEIVVENGNMNYHPLALTRFKEYSLAGEPFRGETEAVRRTSANRLCS